MNNKILPSLDEFKLQAKELKKSGNYSSLGLAQKVLAQKYGYSSYQAILPNLKAIVSSNNELIEGLELPSVQGFKPPQLGSQFASFIAICFGHTPKPEKDILYEYKINTNNIPVNQKAKDFFYTLLLKTADINRMLQPSFFQLIDNNMGELYLKAPYEITYPFGKNRDLLRGVFNEEVITLIFNIKKI
ncbi:hypothetical protein [Arcobacter sp.]|uniref:hypothetical protein n=1 Tax=Arcobacter sp. TaxID=1872629 RepID=UPI003D0F8F99